jgi:hypothetical protein
MPAATAAQFRKLDPVLGTDAYATSLRFAVQGIELEGVQKPDDGTIPAVSRLRSPQAARKLCKLGAALEARAQWGYNTIEAWKWA